MAAPPATPLDYVSTVPENPLQILAIARSGGFMQAINATTQTFTTSSVTLSTNPQGIVVTPNNLYAYVTNAGANTVSVVNLGSNSVVATITVGTGPDGIAITPNGLYVYVANNSSNNVSVINTTTNAVVATIAVGTGPQFIGVTPNGLYAYVMCPGSSNGYVIDTATNTVMTTISLPSAPQGIIITPDGKTAYLSSYGSNNLTILNLATNTVTGNITVGSNPEGMGITPNGRYIYVANNGNATVSVVDTSTNAVVNTITVGASGQNYPGNTVLISPDGLYAYIPMGASATVNSGVIPINIATGAVGNIIVVGSHDSGISLAFYQPSTISSVTQPLTNALPTYNRAYFQSLTAFTTTATTATLITGASVPLTPAQSGIVQIEAILRISNNTIGDGVVVGLYSGATSGALTTLLTSETYTQEGLASNEETFVLHYEESNQVIGTASYYSLALNAVTGGTASAKVIKLAAAEYPDHC